MKSSGDYSIWGFAFGYFAAYVPYSALTKGLSSGFVSEDPIPGVELLPVTAVASLVGMFLFITAMRWWRFSGTRSFGSVAVPWPSRWTMFSGVCTAGVIATTTLAYTFDGVSIVFMMLVMRGGVLVIAPIVDKLSGRTVRWYSIAGLVLSLAALVVAFLEDTGFQLTAVAIADISIYLASYFVRLRFMSKLAKSEDMTLRTRYFVEEQMVATPVLVAFLGGCALVDEGSFMHQVRAGFTSFLDRGVVGYAIVIGVLSQLTGIFGGLILLDKRENTYSVPVNRCSSILAGVGASYAVMIWMGGSEPSLYELAGAGLIVTAILFLTVPVALAKRR